jgi:hypothetical protein
LGFAWVPLGDLYYRTSARLASTQAIVM